MPSREVLVVGAGAVGVVLASHLAAGGARVTFLVRPKHREEATRGFNLYPLSERGHAPQRFTAQEILISTDEVAKRQWDLVLLAIPSSGLEPNWLSALCASIGDAALVSFQPNPDDRELLLAAGARPDRLVMGLVGFVSYLAPLEAEEGFPSPGYAYWLPPLGNSRLAGPEAPRDLALEALRAGGLPVKVQRQSGAWTDILAAILLVYLVSLQLAGWSFSAFTRPEAYRLTARATGEAAAVWQAKSGHGPSGWVLALLGQAWLMRLALWLAGRLTPFSLETYVRAHFTKVAPQTRQALLHLLEVASRTGQPVPTLRSFADRFEAP